MKNDGFARTEEQRCDFSKFIAQSERGVPGEGSGADCLELKISTEFNLIRKCSSHFQLALVACNCVIKFAAMDEYDEFLNHGGPDVKGGFIAHLRDALKSVGLKARKRKRELQDSIPEHLRISSSDLQGKERIGQGSSSVVYRASWLGCEVAVKELPLLQELGGFRGDYPKELEILMRLPHPHVVQLLGYCIEDQPRRLSIVMEYLETALSGVIRRRMRTSPPRGPFHVGEAIDIMTKIALGMRFLHSREIVHGGLSTDIILMKTYAGREFDVKIAGFAFSNYANISSSTRGLYPGFDDHLQIEVTKAEDVYSFASICFAILTGKPYHNSQIIAVEEIRQAVASGSGLPPNIDHSLMELVLKCWNLEPEHRPGFSIICDTLDEIRASRDHVLQKQTTVTDDSGALQWTTRKDGEENTCLEIATILRKMPNHLSIDPADVVWRQLIGEGGYSKVYEVNWLGCAFAMKRFRVLSVSLKEELGFLTQLQHPHIARLIGLSVDSNGGWIMTERMDTDLHKLISSRLRIAHREARTSPPRPFNDSEAWDLCHKIALGVNFLHTKNVVHRDIKPANVLVHDHRGRFDVKITDFGVSHRIGNGVNVATAAGTGLYRAPEVLKRGKPLKEAQLKKTDVYSFAMTCYEIVTGNVLHEQNLSRQDVMNHKRRPTLPAELHSDMVELISKCWDNDPKVRPDFPRICHVLHSLRFPQGTSRSVF